MNNGITTLNLLNLDRVTPEAFEFTPSDETSPLAGYIREHLPNAKTRDDEDCDGSVSVVRRVR